jgi:hypothetical protein
LLSRLVRTDAPVEATLEVVVEVVEEEVPDVSRLPSAEVPREEAVEPQELRPTVAARRAAERNIFFIETVLI